MCTKFLNHNNNRINHVFGGRYCPTTIDEDRHLINVVRYIYQNPVHANIVRTPTEYRYSSLGDYLAFYKSGIILTPDTYTLNLFKNGWEGWNHWQATINNKIPEHDTNQIRTSLKRSKFKYTEKQYRIIKKTGTTLNL